MRGPALPLPDAASTLQFVINAAAGSADARAKAAAIETALRDAGHAGELAFCTPDTLAQTAQRVAGKAAAGGGAVVAVGGDGTISTVARAAHAAACPMGIVPQGTFNYFARAHGIAIDPAQAVADLLRARPRAVPVAALNDRLFLVNASLGLYPDLLQDREAFKARFGRNRWVALGAGMRTLLRAQRPLRLQLDVGARRVKLRALTLFAGINALQLAQLGLAGPVTPASAAADADDDGPITAVVLRPVGTLAMFGLVLHGALGTLGEAQSIAHFRCTRMVVRPAPFGLARRSMKLALDGEVTRMRAPLVFRMLDTPLQLLAADGPHAGADAAGAGA